MDLREEKGKAEWWRGLKEVASAEPLPAPSPRRRPASAAARRPAHLVTEEAESRVLLIYAGGTIGMMRNEHNVLCPVPQEMVSALRRNPVLHDAAFADRRFGSAPIEPATLALPDVHEKNRVIYSVIEYDPLLDSSNMTVEDWSHIANDIRENYEKYDGFVVLHGTDTLSYTASALSFMLENLGKTVIITGSQIPIFEIRGDGRDNLLGALILAGNYVIPEVTVFFGNKLFRGNRTTKVSSESFNAFDSLNFPPLATIGINIEVDYRSFFRQCKIEKFFVQSCLNRNVGLLRLFPSITTETVRAFLQPPTQGVVLQTYGAGNVPSNREDLLAEVRAATQRGVLVVNITQCVVGGVSDLYETGQALVEAGVTPGFDMTPEAALTKLSYVLSKTEWDMPTKRKMMQTSLRGELTPALSSRPLGEWDLVDAVARSLQVTSQREQQELGTILYPAVVNSAVTLGSVDKLESLKAYGIDLSAANADLRTPLHVACCLGNPQIVEHLMKNGANVHVKDRFDRTPLLDAIHFDHHDVIKMLIRCGAHIVGSHRNIGGELCNAAAKGNVRRLQSYKLAGADLNQSDISERTPLHMAVLHNQVEAVNYLLKSGVRKNATDLLGDTPMSIAIKMNHNIIKKLLEDAVQ